MTDNNIRDHINQLPLFYSTDHLRRRIRQPMSEGFRPGHLLLLAARESLRIQEGSVLL